MKKKNFLFLVFCLTILFHSLSFSDTRNLSNSGSESFWPAIATNSNGEIMVIFTENVPGGYTDIFSMISKDGGKTWTQPIRTYSRRAYISAPALAADANGNFHMAYADGYGSGGREIYYRAYINGTWRAKEQLSFTNDNSAWCSICTDGNTVHVAWYQERGWPAKPYIALKSKTIGGTWPSGTVDVSLNPSNGAIHPHIKAKFGNIYAIYVAQDYSGNAYLGRHIGYSERINGIWKGPIKLGGGTWPTLEVDTYRNIHCFYPSDSGGGYAVYKPKINGSWEAEQWINDKRLVSCFFDIKYKNNFLVAAYMQESSLGSQYYSIYYNTKQYKGGWGNWSTPFEIEPGYYAELPKIGMDSSGGVHIIWADIGKGNKMDIFYKKVPLFQADKPYIDVDKSYLSFSAIEGESPKQDTFRIRNSGVGTLSYNIFSDKTWLIHTPLSGQSTGEWDQINVSVDSSSLSPGEYKGTITISSSQAPNSPVEIEVDLKVGSEEPSIDLNTDSLSFTHVKGSSNPPSQYFNIRNFGLGILNYQINPDKPWVSLSTNSGSSSGEWDQIKVYVDATSFDPGDYYAKISITSIEADNSPQQVNVSLQVNESGGGGGDNKASIQLDRLNMYFLNDSPKNFSIRNNGQGIMNYSISANKTWITVSPREGESGGEWDSIKVAVNSSNLPFGVHTGTITIGSSEASNSPRTISVNLTKQKPRIQLDRIAMDFCAIAKGANPETQFFRIRNSKGGSLNYSISTNKAWLKKTPGSGASTGEWDTITVSVNSSSLTVGNHEGRITVNAPGAENSPQHLPVRLKVDLPPYPYQPWNATHKGIANIGLIIQDYVNEISWKKNPKNDGLFNIVKFRIYRKLKTLPQTHFVFLGEVEISHPLNYYDHFSNKEERDKYIYAVTEVDDQGKESLKTVTKLTN